MKGTCVIAWLFSSLGLWRLARPEAQGAPQCQRTEHPVISYKEIGPWLREFRAKNAVDFSQLTFDPGQKELVVGARNYLFRLQLEDLSLIQAVEWECDEATKKACYSKGKSKEECQNYIRVLLVGGDRLFTCGTNAFTPVCTNRSLNNLTEIHDQISGMARCPYSPQHNSTALLTAGGELYAATAMDFPGRDPAIYRSLGILPPLRTAQYNSKWLNEPNFVSSYDIGNFTYFFFRENAVEHDCGKTVFSRAARVCKNDIGGRFLLEDTWTTFMKARLNCSRPGEVPFYYNELQSTFFLPELDLIYGIFTTNVNSIAASAVCVFNLSAIAQAFAGPFKYQENSRSAWLPYPNPNPNFQCGTVDQGLYVNLTERNLQDAQKFILMHEVVQPVTTMPSFMEDNSRFSHVAVDVVQGRDALVHIIYLATDHGTIKKVRAPMNQTSSSCLLEEIELFPERRRESIRSLQILHSQSVLFVGLREHVVKIPLKRCQFYRTRSTCIGAQDPYCGWDVVMKKCTSLEQSLSMTQWEQSISACPIRNLTVDGGFGMWSPWTPCTHTDGSAVGSCLCRTRSCDSPAPQCGGWQCEGPSMEIANCSRNGGWTPWTSWSPCSTTCGIGFQVRQRSCSNPTPRHGGRVCVGQNREERYCNEHLLCPPHMFWTGWGPWERCTAQCGGGIQARRRTCENGPDCAGCNVEYQPCNTSPCPELKKTTPWTPWMPVNISDNGGHYEQRFRYTCKARLPDPNLLEVGRQRIEMRYCSSDGTSGCSTDGLSGDFLRAGRYSAHTVNGAWSAWTSWSQCSRDCSRGIRNRKRVCNNPEPKYGGMPCLGPSLEYQECNILPCPVDGMWSCWSPWTKCSATCGGGHYMRTRSCSNPAPAYGGDICLGLHTEEALCNTQPCPESWSEWSDWSECEASGVQIRSRQCILPFPVGSQCSGNTTESQPCVFDSNFIPEVSVARSSSVEEKRCGEFNMFHMIAVGLSSSILGCLLTLLVYTYCQRYQQQSHDATVIHPVSPAPLNTSITNHINKLDKYDSVEAIKAFNKNNLILEERNKYFNPHLTGKTYSNAYFTDLNNYDDY
ncbi:semaphorin-5A isoform X1 [Sapajus apella]|uniref:Semaphorin-5A n=1 Tax=Sapajus apella TaxID=9515 RepID=A0A6J3HYI0_SAPAP|nr:semaphorin-5A isoform X1 [Sapajus apella]XP_032135000.1 semaphorin-5A isoform X1 [Sapajus apella]XP_032135001.1 semaphorin-5A isoform X1 [Sapajus apella]XP_032135002.1 semaphorin-5A isoform X1 [Sapajus apella]XP_032135003.1 semaphorin-5A isoform X1 [Sapajus apella]XP_032135004.1 semaphorin-5A isoform X1 [Sapajus apella]